ncbi:hypothetical protein [Bacillus sp. FJAT-28004]|uniref:hypothetical protein n=1 Tax=Bacillus sp. FJAT-28004 TaxID=1679165 RepID=UPI0006B42FDD|nr:hypothetical protein [Bacillus sp. FJAT-28004]
MEPQHTGKRSIALPITLVILVFSLIGNVFLYSQFLQNKQENNYVKGQKIFKAAVDSRQYVEKMIPQLDALLQSKSLDERYIIKYDSGKVAANGHALVEFTAEAADVTSQPDQINTELPLTYVSDVDKGLQTIGRYEGPLNESDEAYIVALISSFEAISGVLNGFNTNIGESRIAIIRLSSGLEWVELVVQVQKIMEEHSAKLS